jgi:predicted nuclease of predicted toxin-antitoxin system
VRFLLDESADFRLSSFLRSHGHDVTAIAHDYPQSLLDVDVLAIAVREQRTLITNDRDFGEMIVRDGLTHSGVILFRLRTTALRVKLDRMAVVIESYADQLHRFVVVTEGSVRVLAGE